MQQRKYYLKKWFETENDSLESCFIAVQKDSVASNRFFREKWFYYKLLMKAIEIGEQQDKDLLVLLHFGLKDDPIADLFCDQFDITLLEKIPFEDNIMSSMKKHRKDVLEIQKSLDAIADGLKSNTIVLQRSSMERLNEIRKTIPFCYHPVFQLLAKDSVMLRHIGVSFGNTDMSRYAIHNRFDWTE